MDLSNSPMSTHDGVKPSMDLSKLTINTYDDLKPYLDDLATREVNNKEEAAQWISDYDKLNATISEDFARRYIRQSCDTENEEFKKKYNFFVTEISPKLQEIDDTINKKIVTLPGIEKLESEDEAYALRVRNVRKSLEMFREENIPLNTEDTEKDTQYGEIAGAMTIEHDNQTLTLQQATKYLEQTDVAVRKEVYEKCQNRRMVDAEKIDDLLSDLIKLRNKIARNAGYESFVEYQWDGYARFDYTQQDVFNFHDGVREYVVPLLTNIYNEKKHKLGVDTLKPYDLLVEGKDDAPLTPFSTAEELLEKGILVMQDVHAEFGDDLRKMKDAGHFDLGSRVGKRPGGYNYPLAVSVYPFIFMNAAGTQRDLETFVHEAGHAMHSFAMEGKIGLNIFKNYPIEIAEVASMSMELITMPFWKRFYEKETDLIKAQKKQLDGSLDVLPWISIIDSFQYWIYKNENHTIAERDAKFAELLETYHPRIDRSGYENFQHKRRQAQLHIFGHPFYYIEYGIAQLGAIGVWKNYLNDPKQAIEKYLNALALGSTKKLPELYEAAGVPFDFSPARIKELADFAWSEREKIGK